MCSTNEDLNGFTIELDVSDFEDIQVDEPSFSRLELAFFEEGEELDPEIAAR